MRLPNSHDLRAFCKADGWTPDRKTGHIVFHRTLACGDVLTTIVSHGNKQIQDPDLFARICREELRCTPAEFWEAVDHGRPVPRPQPTEPERSDPIPYGLIKALEAQEHSRDTIGRLRNRSDALDLLKRGRAADG